MSFTFYKFAHLESNVQNCFREEKIYLQTSIADHPIWKEIEFWESAMFNSINEEFAAQRIYKLEESESISDTSMRQRNLIFGQLASYSHNMLMFNIDKTEVKNITSRFCRLYDLQSTQVREIIVLCQFIVLSYD